VASSTSTATFIAYDLRPAKQAERRIVLDILALAGECGIRISDYRYVGLGANRFYDFLLFHRYLGLSTMVSIEHDDIMFRRAVFNVPFNFIEVRNETVLSFLQGDTAERQSVYWLDYDRGITTGPTGDIVDLGARMEVGDFCFITLPAVVPPATADMSSRDRLAWLEDALGAIVQALKPEDVEKANYVNAVGTMLLVAFRNAFATREGGVFTPLLRVRYKDSMPMVTVGGAFLTEDQSAAYVRRIAEALPFLASPEPELYNIKTLALTDKERVLFDRASTTRDEESEDEKIILSFGFTLDDIAAHGELLRYMPRYVETIF
jgi:hypothetical protein